MKHWRDCTDEIYLKSKYIIELQNNIYDNFPELTDLVYIGNIKNKIITIFCKNQSVTIHIKRITSKILDITQCEKLKIRVMI